MSSEWAEQAGPDSNGNSAGAAGAASSGASANAANHAAEASGAPGKILAAQREAMGWSVEQVADQLKLAVRQVVALEAGDNDALPGPAVVRGFVRAYAKIVRLDPAPLVAKISLDLPAPSDASHTPLRHNKPASFSEVRFPTHGRRALPIMPIVVMVLLLGAAFAAWHFGLLSKWSKRGSNGAASTVIAPMNTSNAVTPPASAAGTVAAPLTSLQNPSVPLISVPPPSAAAGDTPAAATSTAPAGPITSTAVATPATANAAGSPVGVAAAAPAAAAGPNALVLTVNADSWIEIRRARGAPLIARLVKAGSTETFDITEPVTLVVGKPGAVTATLRGAAVALPGAGTGAVARVSLK